MKLDAGDDCGGVGALNIKRDLGEEVLGDVRSLRDPRAVLQSTRRRDEGPCRHSPLIETVLEALGLL